jgi:hypothetical protein
MHSTPELVLQQSVLELHLLLSAEQPCASAPHASPASDATHAPLQH